MISFKNKKILITGATGGIGNELVKKFSNLGGNIVATGTKAEKLDIIKKKYSNVKLHMVGKLQTNKVKTALKIFDYIHSVDNYKLAEKIVKYEKELGKKIKTFVQVNIGEESQKNGISPKNINQFVNYCKDGFFLNIIGLMCLPPLNENPEKYFLYLNQLRNQTALCHLSMGMSNDYQIATKCGSTFLRIGSKILGERNSS